MKVVLLLLALGALQCDAAFSSGTVENPELCTGFTCSGTHDDDTDSWHVIKAPPGHQILLTFASINFETDYDYLVVYDGAPHTREGGGIGLLRAHGTDSTRFKARSSTNELWLHQYTDYSTVGNSGSSDPAGFTVTWTTVAPGTGASCETGSILSNTPGSWRIVSGEFPPQAAPGLSPARVADGQHAVVQCPIGRSFVSDTSQLRAVEAEPAGQVRPVTLKRSTSSASSGNWATMICQDGVWNPIVPEFDSNDPQVAVPFNYDGCVTTMCPEEWLPALAIGEGRSLAEWKELSAGRSSFTVPCKSVGLSPVRIQCENNGAWRYTGDCQLEPRTPMYLMDKSNTLQPMELRVPPRDSHLDDPSSFDASKQTSYAILKHNDVSNSPCFLPELNWSLRSSLFATPQPRPTDSLQCSGSSPYTPIGMTESHGLFLWSETRFPMTVLANHGYWVVNFKTDPYSSGLYPNETYSLKYDLTEPGICPEIDALVTALEFEIYGSSGQLNITVWVDGVPAETVVSEDTWYSGRFTVPLNGASTFEVTFGTPNVYSTTGDSMAMWVNPALLCGTPRSDGEIWVEAPAHSGSSISADEMFSSIISKLNGMPTLDTMAAIESKLDTIQESFDATFTCSQRTSSTAIARWCSLRM